MTAADPTAGLAAFLDAQEAVHDAVEGRIYRPAIPEENERDMPQAAIVIRPSGGGQRFGRDMLPVNDSRIDVLCYGSTRQEAANIGREVMVACKLMERGTWEEVVLIYARTISNVGTLIDPETNWPFAVLVFDVMHSLETVA